jgi:TatD DNase family protein
MFIDIHTHNPNHADICCINTMPKTQHHYAVYSCGLHPWYLANATTDLESLVKIAKQQHCIAIGECGLDKLCTTDWQTQEYFFTAQVQLANAINKPIIIHCVKASTEIIAILKKLNNNVPIIIHGFNQNKNILAQWLDIDAYISIGHAINNANSNAHLLLQNIPSNKLFLETDNSTISIETIYQAAANILHLPINNVAQQISTNYNTIFAQQI